MNRWPALSSRARAIEPTLIRSLRSKMGPETIDFGLGQADLPVSTVVKEALLQDWKEEIFAPYTPNAGLIEAREAVGRHCGVQAKEVLLTCGVQEALAVTIFGFLEHGDEVLVPDPGFPAYENLVRAAGGIPVPYRLRPPDESFRGWKLDLEEALKGITSSTKLAILNNPSNPTGTVLGRESLASFLNALEDQGVVWISDEIYEDYDWGGSFTTARELAPHGSGLTLSGLSKSHHLMSWRLGWILGPEEIIEGLTPLHQHLVTSAPLPAQRAAIAALGSHHEAFSETAHHFRRRREIGLETLEDLEVIYPEGAGGAFYFFLDLRPWMSTFPNTLALAEALLREEDVMTVPGEGFGKQGLGHLRLAYTIEEKKLRTGLIRVRRFLERYQP